MGAGLAGLGAAWQLSRRGLANALVLEKCSDVGGNAGSFELTGLQVDYGSHRLHPVCDPEILDDIRLLIGDDLLTRPRHGRIRLGGRWIHFPLKAADLLTNLPWGFRLRIAGDIMRKALPAGSGSNTPSFASILEEGLGKTISREFYLPYARKIWGLAPEELSPIQARRRVSVGSLGKMVRKVLTGGKGASGSKARFLYPRGGFGQIASAMAATAREAGVDLHLETEIRAVDLGPPHRVEFDHDGQSESVQADHVWSTIPMNSLPRLIHPEPPDDVHEACSHMKFRQMILVYLVLEQGQFSEFDAHYFPGSDVPVTRVSEPKNYSDVREPENSTVLCAELPCFETDPEWTMTDAELGAVVSKSLERACIPLKSPPEKIVTRRISHAYPIYNKGYELYFDRIDRWLGQLENVLSFGRQGLFAHDNIHHALHMAYSAVNCLNQDGRFDTEKWENYRQDFKNHVVED